jgi:uncharacterized iron-regulated membrane protein
MTTRNYQTFFNLHSVVGITISIGLFVIFFAGAFALFEPEIHHWEEKETVSALSPVQYPGRDASLSTLDYDRILADLKAQGHYLSGRGISFMRTGEPGQVSVGLGRSQDSVPAGVAVERKSLFFDTRTKTLYTHEDGFSMGHFMVDLHFFGQLGRFGLYLAGAIAFLFLIAVVTGIGVHWKNIFTNLFWFRSKAKLKMVLTDAHTVLGTLGIPFQVMYAVTGAYFCLGILTTLPVDVFKERVPIQADEPSLWPSFPRGEKSDVPQSVNAYIGKTLAKWPGYEPTYVSISNYANENMHLQIDGRAATRDRFFGFGTIIYHVPSGKIVRENDPFRSDYAAGVPMAMWMLHYGEFDRMVSQASDLFFRVVYFLLAMLTCFVIVSGVLMWVEVRKKRSDSVARKRFNEGLGHFFLAACLTLFPVTAVSFLASKLFPEGWAEHRELALSSLFFGGWLLSTLFLWWKGGNGFTARLSFLTGGIAALCIPLVSGVFSENWLWYTWSKGHYDVFLVDALWLFLGLTALYSTYRIFAGKKEKG